MIMKGKSICHLWVKQNSVWSYSLEAMMIYKYVGNYNHPRLENKHACPTEIAVLVRECQMCKSNIFYVCFDKYIYPKVPNPNFQEFIGSSHINNPMR